MAADFEELASGRDAQFETRIDVLVASAVEEQAREQRLLLETVQAAQAETARLRQLIEGQDHGLNDMLEGRLAGIATHEALEEISGDLIERLAAVTRILERLDPWKPAMEVQRTLARRFSEGVGSLTELLGDSAASVGASLGEMRSFLDSFIKAFEEQSNGTLASTASELRETIQATGARSFDRLMQLQEDMGRMAAALDGLPQVLEIRLEEIRTEGRASAAATSRQMEGLRESVESQPRHLAGEMGRTFEPFAEELRGLAARVRRSNMKSSELSARLEAMHASVVSYLAERDERLEKVRDGVLAELVEGIAQNLKRRDRVRMGEALRRAEQERKDRRDARRYRKMMAKTPEASVEPQPLSDDQPVIVAPQPFSHDQPVIVAPKAKKPAATRTKKLASSPVNSQRGAPKPRRKPAV